MRTRKNILIFFLSSLLLWSCAGEPKSDKIGNASLPKKIVGTIRPKKVIPENVDYDSINKEIAGPMRLLDSVYSSAPYYAVLDNRKIFVVMEKNGVKYDYDDQFSGKIHYGLADSAAKEIVPCRFDKIYNPNMTMLNCMEIKKNGVVGLYNFKTGEILEPEFEYIVPEPKPGKQAFAFKDGQWYLIEGENKFKVSKTGEKPREILKNLSFDMKDVKENFFFDSYVYESPEETMGSGVFLTPSYMERLKIMPEISWDFVMNDQGAGLIELNVKTTEERTIGDKIIAFIVSFYDQGTDARGYVDDVRKMVVYNTAEHHTTTTDLNRVYNYSDNVPHPDGYKFINDTLVEVLQNQWADEKGSSAPRYTYENTYFYKSIGKDGQITELQSNRYYNFTQYVEIDENYFKGSFAKFDGEFGESTKESADDNNMTITEHLSLDDLDLMTNEIYADYGMRFKTEKWKNYFSKLKWYDPQFDNVEDKLSPIDKKNIRTIAKEKAKMKGKEDEITKQHRISYTAAG